MMELWKHYAYWVISQAKYLNADIKLCESGKEK